MHVCAFRVQVELEESIALGLSLKAIQQPPSSTKATNVVQMHQRAAEMHLK
jgi:hypothetical protein